MSASQSLYGLVVNSRWNDIYERATTYYICILRISRSTPLSKSVCLQSFIDQYVQNSVWFPTHPSSIQDLLIKLIFIVAHFCFHGPHNLNKCRTLDITYNPFTQTRNENIFHSYILLKGEGDWTLWLKQTHTKNIMGGESNKDKVGGTRRLILHWSVCPDD